MALGEKQERWVHDIRARLVWLLHQPSAPKLDIEWLVERCDDTLFDYQGHLQLASLKQLQKDVTTFDERFPGLIPGELLSSTKGFQV